MLDNRVVRPLSILLSSPKSYDCLVLDHTQQLCTSLCLYSLLFDYVLVYTTTTYTHNILHPITKMFTVLCVLVAYVRMYAALCLTSLCI